MPVRCSVCTRSAAGRYGNIKTSYVLELRNSDTTIPPQEDAKMPACGKEAEGASSPNARMSCPGHGEGLPGGGAQNDTTTPGATGGIDESSRP